MNFKLKSLLGGFVALSVSSAMATTVSIDNITDAITIDADMTGIGEPYSCEITNAPSISFPAITEVGTYIQDATLDIYCESDSSLKMVVTSDAATGSVATNGSNTLAFATTDAYSMTIGYVLSGIPDGWTAHRYHVTDTCSASDNTAEVYTMLGENVYPFGKSSNSSVWASQGACLITSSPLEAGAYSFPVKIELVAKDVTPDPVNFTIPIMLATSMEI